VKLVWFSLCFCRTPVTRYHKRFKVDPAMLRHSSLFRSVTLCWLLLLHSHVIASPSQYYAQVYTEILGRNPTPSEWVANEYRFTPETISVQQVSGVVTSLLQSSEFNQLGYTPTERAFLLYRAILLREPSTTELSALANQLNGGTPITSAATTMMSSAEFANLINGPVKSSRAHGFVNSTPVLRPTIGTGGLGNVTVQQLQEALDAAKPGETVFLSRGALVQANQTIRIPEGVTLSTYDAGSADKIFRNRRAYAAMGRIVRTEMFARPLVELAPGAKLMGVWVDGRRSQLRQNDPTLNNRALSREERFFDSHNVRVLGGSTPSEITHVAFCKISDSTGWTGIHGVGADGGLAVGYSRIANNMISSYTSNRDLAQSFFTDGISNASSDAVILNNDIVDPSDVGIVIFNPGMHTGQRSQVATNSILFAGIEGFGGISIDHSVGIRQLCMGVNPEGMYNCFDLGNPGVIADFSGMLLQGNLIWSSDAAHTNVGISVGVHLWGLRMFGMGSNVVANRLGTAQQPLNAGVGIVIAGIREPVVLDNELHLKLDQNLISSFSTRLMLDPLSTTITNPTAQLQPGFTTGEAWSLLQPKSNGFIFGEFHLQPRTASGQSVVQAEEGLKIHSASGTQLSEQWTIIHSERNFGDSRQYYVIKNRATFQVMEATGNQKVEVHPFSGADSQYWQVGGEMGEPMGRGMRVFNRATGEYLGRDAAGNVIVSSVFEPNNFSWRFQKIEKRPIDTKRPSLKFLNPIGDVFQIHLESGRIWDDRNMGNPALLHGIDFFGDDSSVFKPLGLLDYNRDGRMDLALTNDRGRIFIAFLTEDGYTAGGFVGEMRDGDFFGWNITSSVNSWEKPVGFVDLGQTATEDLVVINPEGRIKVGFMTEQGIGSSAIVGDAAGIGLPGATSLPNSPFKPLGSGDFDGDGKRELLFVGPAGGMFMVKAANGQLQQAVSMGNPLERFGHGVRSDHQGVYKPVAITDVNGDRSDDLIIVGSDGTLVAVLIRNGAISGVQSLGNPLASWSWNLSSVSGYSRPLAIPFGWGWWDW
jgi:hypothetical protein